MKPLELLCSNLTSGEDAFDSFVRWYRIKYAKYSLGYSYEITLKTNRKALQLHPTLFYYCTQFGSTRVTTSANGFENCFPHVITEQFHDQMCSDIFGTRYAYKNLFFHQSPRKESFPYYCIFTLRISGTIVHCSNEPVITLICNMAVEHSTLAMWSFQMEI